MSINILGKTYDIDSRKICINNSLVKEIPENLTIFTNLQILSLALNQIKKIPNNFTNLVNLKRLDISYNKIKEIPYSFCNLINLQELDLSNNEIKEIPNNFSNFIHLKMLFLENNQIMYIPISIMSLKNLITFYHHDNQIENINPIIQRFLQRINDRGQNIHNIYNDKQNIHASSIQKSVKDSIIKIFSCDIKNIEFNIPWFYFSCRILL